MNLKQREETAMRRLKEATKEQRAKILKIVQEAKANLEQKRVDPDEETKVIPRPS